MTFVFAMLLLNGGSSANMCPSSCVCSTTRDSLHRAACGDLAELYKYTLRQKHHNINILDLSHNNITKLSHELDRLTEVVTLDLSNNGIKEINKFLYNAKKLVHLNLGNNRMEKLSLSFLPKSISSLDLTNNLLKDLPSDLRHLNELEHLELEGNPLDCECENIVTRDYLLSSNVHVDNVKCATPIKLKGRSWLELKTKDICKIGKPQDNSFLDEMMGDQPIDAMQIGRETTELKSMPLVALNDLEDGDVLDGASLSQMDDEEEFIKADIPKSHKSVSKEVESSGDYESTTIADDIIVKNSPVLESKILENEHMLPATEIEHVTENELEGSGEEGSGFGWIHHNEIEIETTTETYGTLFTGPIQPFFENDFGLDSTSTTEYPTPKPVTIFMGGRNWIDDITQAPVEEKMVTSTTHIVRDTTVSEQIRVTQASQNTGQVSAIDEKTTPHKTGTYVCIAIIIILLVGLIGFAIVKGQIRRRRDRRILRQQKMDVEKASREMVDMNKSLLGKPALAVEVPVEKKSNGKYELVPTHESYRNGRKGERPIERDITNGAVRQPDVPQNGLKSESPRDNNQNKNSSKDNNLDETDVPMISQPPHDSTFDSTASQDDSKIDTHSLSSEEICIPNDNLYLNGIGDSEVSRPLINGDQSSDFLSPREYVPVYSPDLGRVRIKMTEMPKPKTPVLVTRSRSNAGDIIVTPTVGGNSPKSTT